MRILRNVLLFSGIAAVGAVPMMGQVHKYFSPGTVWTVTMIKMASGMDQMYCSTSTPRSRSRRTHR